MHVRIVLVLRWCSFVVLTVVRLAVGLHAKVSLPKPCPSCMYKHTKNHLFGMRLGLAGRLTLPLA